MSALMPLLCIAGAIAFTLSYGWLLRKTWYDWEELSVIQRLGAAIAITLMSIPLSVFVLGIVGGVYGISLFFCIFSD